MYIYRHRDAIQPNYMELTVYAVLSLLRDPRWTVLPGRDEEFVDFELKNELIVRIEKRRSESERDVGVASRFMSERTDLFLTQWNMKMNIPWRLTQTTNTAW